MVFFRVRPPQAGQFEEVFMVWNSPLYSIYKGENSILKSLLLRGFCSEAGDDKNCADEPHCDKVHPHYPRQIEEVFD